MTDNLERKILVVDDDQSHRERVVGALSACNYNSDNGYQIEEVNDGSIAVERAKDTKYHLITMDWVMNKMSGIDATQKIREFDEETPIVIISTGSDCLGVTKIGANAYVDKRNVKRLLPTVLNQIYQE